MVDFIFFPKLCTYHDRKNQHLEHLFNTFSLSFSTQKTPSVLFFFLFFFLLWNCRMGFDLMHKFVSLRCWCFWCYCCCSPHHHDVSDFWRCRFFFEKIHLISGYAGLFEKSLRIRSLEDLGCCGFWGAFRRSGQDGVCVCVCERIGGSRKLRCVWSSNLSLLDVNLQQSRHGVEKVL